jgi:DNA gyrase/topoisomerase IV subunit B
MTEISENSFTDVEFTQWYESIRKRPAMYLSNTKLDGFANMLVEVFAELLYLNKRPIDIVIHLEKNDNIAILINEIDVEIISKKFENILPLNTPYFGLLILFPLNNEAKVYVKKDKNKLDVFEGNENTILKTSTDNEGQRADILIEFSINRTIFKDMTLDFDYFCDRFQEFAYLNSNTKISVFNNAVEDPFKVVYQYEKGIFRKFNTTIAKLKYFNPEFRIDICNKVNEFEYQISLAYCRTSPYSGSVKTYANNDELLNGGSLADGIVDGLYMGFNELIKTHKLKTPKLNKKKIRSGLFALGQVKGDDFIFYGSMKWKLGMPNIKEDVAKIVCLNLISELNNDTNRIIGIIDYLC